jgi:hypothetical protein
MVTEDFAIDQMHKHEESTDKSGEELFCERHGIREQLNEDDSFCPMCLKERNEARETQSYW